MIEFDCPICADQVEMIETSHHNLKQLSKSHLPQSPYESEIKGCPISYSRNDHFIREEYDFIKHKLPVVFLKIPALEQDEETLETAIRSMDHLNIGVTVEFPLSNSTTGFAYAWRFDPGPTYYGVVRNIFTPANVLSAYTIEELIRFMRRWFHWEPEID